jgi:hypothetical protein
LGIPLDPSRLTDAGVSRLKLFGAVPRLAAFLGGLLLLMPWMLKKSVGNTLALFSDFSRYAR